MKLFTKDPLDAARDSKTKLAERLAAAETAVIEKKATTKRLAVEGADDSVLDKAEAACRAAQDRVSTLTVAILEVENNIADLVAEKFKQEDEKIRAATVLELEVIERDFTRAADDTVSSAKRLSEVATRMATFIPDAAGLSIFAASVASETPANVVMLKTLLRGHVSTVLSGHGRATIPQPAAPAVILAHPAPKELVQVVSIKNVAFHDGNVVRTAHAGYTLSLSPAVAAAALKSGACVEPQDPRAKHHEIQRKPTTPLIENCVALDSHAAAAIAAAVSRGSVVPIMRSPPPGLADASRPLQQAASRALPLPPGFEPLDRGPAYVVRVPAGNPAPGQENDDES